MGREKAPAAICRKVALAGDGGDIEVWGDGNQTRSFTYVDDCVDGIFRLTQSDHARPLNVQSGLLRESSFQFKVTAQDWN